MESDLQQQGGDSQEAKKPSDQILRHELVEAQNALEQSTGRLIFSGIATGLNIGFSVFFMALLQTTGKHVLSTPVLDLLTATLYSFGFILVVLGRSELFTEQTTLAVIPVLMGRARLKSLVWMWGIVYGTNLAGAAAFAALIAWLGPAMGVIEPRAFGQIAHRLVNHSGPVMIGSGFLAGWLMGLLSWLVAAGRDTISQIVIVWLIASAIGLGRLHHCVVGTIEVLAGVFSGQGTGAADFGWFLLWATVGNMLGGMFFAALIVYGHMDRHIVAGRMPENQ